MGSSSIKKKPDVEKKNNNKNVPVANSNSAAPLPVQNMINQPLERNQENFYLNDYPSEKVQKPSNCKKINNEDSPPIQQNQNILRNNQNIPRQNQNIPQQNGNYPNQPQPHMPIGVASPYIQPVGMPPVNPNSANQVVYYPGGPYYPYPYYGPPQQPQPNIVYVLPPGYKRDNSPGFSPWGNLEEDLRTLF